MTRESCVSGPEALDAFAAMALMNLRLFEGLSATDRAVEMSHPEYGTISVDWIIHLLPGHQIHHIEQLANRCNLVIWSFGHLVTRLGNRSINDQMSR